MRRHAPGLIRSSTPGHDLRRSSLLPLDTTSLPPLNAIEHWLGGYYASVSHRMPILHWPTFRRDLDALFTGDVQAIPKSWLALLFAVLACGTLHSMDGNRFEDGMECLRRSINMLGPPSEEGGLDHCRASFLISLFFYEVNERHSSLLWHGRAVTTAQCDGLYLETNAFGEIETETRRCTWFTLYAWDR